MYVIEVIPLKRGIQSHTLSYFSGTLYAEGNILTIPVKNREILGIVSSCTEASMTKTALRAATFSLRKLPHQEEVPSLSPAYIKTAKELAEYYATTTGAVLYSMLPPLVRNGEAPLPRTHHVTTKGSVVPEVFHAHKKDRYLLYRSLVRETFVHSGSVVCVAPTSAEVDDLYELLSPGIDERVVRMTSSMTKKQVREAYTLMEDFRKPKLIIATPSHAVIERHDVTLVIVEHERSPYFKGRSRPYLDIREVLKIHCKYTGRRLIFADLFPRSEEEYARRIERYQTCGETPKRIEFSGTLSIINMKDAPKNGAPFKLFSPKAIDAITETYKERGHVFLFAAHRGLAPVVA